MRVLLVRIRIFSNGDHVRCEHGVGTVISEKVFFCEAGDFFISQNIEVQLHGRPGKVEIPAEEASYISDEEFLEETSRASLEVGDDVMTPFGSGVVMETKYFYHADRKTFQGENVLVQQNRGGDPIEWPSFNVSFLRRPKKGEER